MGVIPGEVIGGMVGEGANQLAGITPPSLANIGWAGASGPIGRAAGAVIKGVGTGALKSFAGRDAVAEAANRVFEKVLGPASPSSVLFKKLHEASAIIPTGDIARTTSSILAAEGQQAKLGVNQAIKDAVSAIDDLVKANPEGIASNVLQTEINRISGLASKALENRDTIDLGRKLFEVRGAMLDALEKSGMAGRAAMAAFRREQGIKDLAYIVGRAHPVKGFNEALANNKLLAGTFPTEVERESIRQILGRVSTATWSGFSGVAGRLAAGYGVGTIFGGIPGIITAAALPEAVARLVANPAGRVLMDNALKNPRPMLNFGTFMAGAVQAIRAQASSDPTTAAAIAESIRSPGTIGEKMQIITEFDAMKAAAKNLRTQ